MTTPTTINDINDLFRILRDNPEWRDQLRSVLLTQEILELPAALAALTQEVREFIAEQRAINQEQKRTNDAIFARLDRIEQDVAEAKADIKDLKSDMVEAKSDIKDLKTTVGHLVGTVNRMDGTVSQLVGDWAERKVHANIDNMLHQRQRGLRSLVILKSVNQHLNTDLSDELADAADEGLITPEEMEALRSIDLITRARLKDTGETIYHAVEVSVTVDNHDVQRAIARADILSRATKTKTIPVVVGGSIIPAAADLAHQSGALAIATSRLSA